MTPTTGKGNKAPQSSPSVSITALPRQPNNTMLMPNNSRMSNAGGASTSAVIPQKPPNMANMKPGQSPHGHNKNSYVICEICDGYIKDLEQLRTHMQSMHKVKVGIIAHY